MKINKCPNGHFYDSDSFQECPHCTTEEKKEKSRFMKKRGAGASSVSESSSPAAAAASSGKASEPVNTGFVCEPTELIYIPEEPEPEEIPIILSNEDVFLPPPEDAYDSSALLFATFPEQNGKDNKRVPASDVQKEPSVNCEKEETCAACADCATESRINNEAENAAAALPEDSCITAREEKGCAESAATDDANASSSGPEKAGETTDSSSPSPEDGPDEQGYTGENVSPGFDPVVGWLVCTYGRNAGKSYELYCGRNSAGNSRTFTLPLSEGQTRSDGALFYIVFVPDSDSFLLQPGSSRELVYLNRGVLTGTEAIEETDEICTCHSVYRLVKYCGRLTEYETYGKYKSV